MTKLKMNITTKDDLKAENGRLKRELEVRERAINDLQLKLGQSVSLEHFKKETEDLIDRLEETEKDALLLDKQKRISDEKYHKEHSLVIQLDGEVENLREQLRQAREESVKYGKENEHLWGLLKIKMEG